MKDTECIKFLQETLPKINMQWNGFRKVRKQVCKRINKRLAELSLKDLKSYEKYLNQNPKEWKILDSLCRVTITRFFRNKKTFEYLGQVGIPYLIQNLLHQKIFSFKCWSAGCASGEEPYSLKLAWEHLVEPFPGKMILEILATDIDADLLKRAEQARYPQSSLKELPNHWVSEAFDFNNKQFTLKEKYKHNIQFIKQDIRKTDLEGPFDLILCRNLAFTYYDFESQVKILSKIDQLIRPEGLLVLGNHESLPDFFDSRYFQLESSLPIFSKKTII